jgi:hypothetical protein
MNNREFLLQTEVAPFLRELGYPVGDSTFVKICARGDGPPVDAWYGNRPLRKPETAITWAKARLTNKPSSGRWADKAQAEPLTA